MEQNVETMSFEEALKGLDELIEDLNKGDLPLEETMDAYERGMTLALHCQKQLSKAEGSLKKIEGELIEAFRLEEDDHGVEY